MRDHGDELTRGHARAKGVGCVGICYLHSRLIRLCSPDDMHAAVNGRYFTVLAERQNGATVAEVDPLAIVGVVARVVVPIFVAMDPVGALPLVFAWTAGLEDAERDRQLRDALLTALALGLVFVLAGRWLLGLLGVDIPDFLVAGGLVLLVLAISDLVVGGSHEGRGSSGVPDFGAVPIGTPILAGPATLATLLVLVDDYGWLITGAAFLLNLLFAWRLFRRAGQLTRLFGRNGLRAASKVMSLILAAIAVRLIRDGLFAILGLPS
jgi:multiple antibiotic resistance protein